MIEEIIAATLKVISECDCRDGCPSCVGAGAQTYMKPAESASRDQIPDKHAALAMLHSMMGLPDYVPAAGERKPISRELKMPEFNPLPHRIEKKIHRRLSGKKIQKPLNDDESGDLE